MVWGSWVVGLFVGCLVFCFNTFLILWVFYVCGVLLGLVGFGIFSDVSFKFVRLDLWVFLGWGFRVCFVVCAVLVFAFVCGIYKGYSG